MEIVTGIILYFIIWWTLIFMVLPWGNAPSQTIIKGHCPSAPAKPRLVKKLIWNTALTTLVWGIIYVCIKSRLIDLAHLPFSKYVIE